MCVDLGNDSGTSQIELSVRDVKHECFLFDNTGAVCIWGLIKNYLMCSVFVSHCLHGCVCVCVCICVPQ